MAHPRDNQRMRQSQYMETVATEQISKVDMSASEYHEKESFRAALERICHEVCDSNPTRLPKISLEPFGSFKSGFATAGSDMDLVIVVKDRSSTSACFSLLEDDLPRALEKRLLELGIGARLLSRTRVPILKICEKPAQELLGKLREEREKWDASPEEEKYPHLHQSNSESVVPEEEAPLVEAVENGETLDIVPSESITSKQPVQRNASNGHSDVAKDQATNGTHEQTDAAEPTPIANGEAKAAPKGRRDDNKPWTRERKAGPLDFPKSGVGIQSDINFFNPLGLHNTQLLHCYSLSDPRVRPIVLFIKSWAKHRKINSSYSGTLSSYGYVLMVLHYLTNVANPPVLQNLQATWTPQGASLPQGEDVDGWQVRFWRNNVEITAAAQRGQLNNNRESVGSLLAGFFHYYSSLSGGYTFRWMNEVLSLRSRGGIMTKEEKGWVRAVTEEGEGKKIQHRYLFCIEDPFELNHNVARTVTHKGIVAIRDEFRRAHRILLSIGNGLTPIDGELFDDLVEYQHQDLVANSTTTDTVDGASGMTGLKVQVGAAVRSKQEKGTRLANHQQFHKVQQHPAGYPRPRSGFQHHQPSQLKSEPINTQDNEAFPALSTPAARATPTKRKKKSPDHIRDDDTNYSEISGDKAKAILERVKQERDEKQAESTATLAAESVLSGID